jgi:hypothetical protein
MLNRSSASKLKINQTLRSFRKAVKLYSEASAYQNLDYKVKFNLCCARILQGNFKEWDGWQYRDEWAATMREGIKTIPFWVGNNVDSLIVIGEQGIGDEILWASLLPECSVRVNKVSYACDERLVKILKDSLNIDSKQRNIDARDDLLGGYSAYIPAADLLCLFRKRKEDFPRKPFIKVNSERVKEFEKYRGRIGVSWRGRHGYLDPRDLKLKNPLSLQYDEQMFDGSDDIERPDLDLRNDIEGVIALISVLEKVVTVPTSVMHFAGSIGKRCEVIKTKRKSELEVDGVIDELDWHVPYGKSPFYKNSFVFENIKEWTNANR